MWTGPGCPVVAQAIALMGGARIDTAGDDDQRHAVLARVLDDVDGVQRSGSDGGHEEAGGAGRMMHALGHEAAGILVADEHELDAGAAERVHEGQHFATRHSEGVADSGGM